MCRSVQLNKENSRKKKNIEFRFTSFHYCTRYIILHRPYIASIRNTKQSVTGSKLQRRHIAHLHRNFNLITRESWARAATRLFTWRCSFYFFVSVRLFLFLFSFFFFFPSSFVLFVLTCFTVTTSLCGLSDGSQSVLNVVLPLRARALDPFVLFFVPVIFSVNWSVSNELSDSEFIV